MPRAPLKALVVDRSRANRLVVSKHLTALGFQVADASDGREGLLCLKNDTQFNVVIVDAEIPGMTGLEFIRHVLAEPATKELPVIMVSSMDTRDVMVEAIEAGASEYIMKPITKEALGAKLDLVGLEYR